MLIGVSLIDSPLYHPRGIEYKIAYPNNAKIKLTFNNKRELTFLSALSWNMLASTCGDPFPGNGYSIFSTRSIEVNGSI